MFILLLAQCIQLSFVFDLVIALNQHRMIIFEGSCDAEDWSNDAENSVFHHRNTVHFNIY